MLKSIIFLTALISTNFSFAQQKNLVSLNVGNETYTGIFEDNAPKDTWTNYRNSSLGFGIQYQRVTKKQHLIGISCSYANRVVDGMDSIQLYRSTNDYLKFSLSFAKEIKLLDKLSFQMTSGLFATTISTTASTSLRHNGEKNQIGGIYGDFPLLFSFKEGQYMKLGYKLELDAYSKQSVHLIGSSIYIGYQIRF